MGSRRTEGCTFSSTTLKGEPAVFTLMEDLGSWLGEVARKAGRSIESARNAFVEGRISGSLPRDEEGRAQIVCRRYAERRAVHLHQGEPECYEAGNADCEACVVDIEDGTIETW